jgi:hypothetical protein
MSTTTTANPASHPHVKFRASRTTGVNRHDFGPLVNLPGTWVGSGFNLISLPDFDPNPPSTGPKPFRLLLNSTREVLEFEAISGPIPNRGVEVPGAGATPAGQLDINIFGLRYLQRVTDIASNQAIHIEPGLWLHVPATSLPSNTSDTVIRQASIPHGTSLLAQGNAIPGPIKVTKPPGPIIEVASSTPVPVPPTPPLAPAYLAPFNNPPLPPGFKLDYVANPNQALTDVLNEQIANGQTISSMDVLVVSSAAANIVNIPFLVKNADAVQFNTTFWVEIVDQKEGPPFLQLQYTQTVVLNFLGINWPHISVATLIKQ